MFHYGESTFFLRCLPNDYDPLAMPTEIVEVNTDSDNGVRTSRYVVAYHNLGKLGDAIDSYIAQKTLKPIRVITDG